MSELIDITAAISRLLKAENILLLCHKNPDGDTIGSAAALYWALVKLGKTVGILCADEIPQRYSYMEISLFHNEFEPQYIVAIDVAGIQLFGDTLSEYAKRVDMCIDHHPSNSGYAECMLLNGDAAATAEIIYELICTLGVSPEGKIANCLYTGISTDTGCFKFGNTTARTHEIAAKLMEAGANTVFLNDALFESKSRRRLDIEKLALENLRFFYEDRCALTYLTYDEIAKTGADGTDLEGITGMPRAIEGVQVGVTLRQLESGSYKISVRTVHTIDAAAICARLGGGGHKQASGCEIIGGLDNAKAAILAEVEKELCKVS
ncbi:MAG: bifunctional oligoribonuclease/PAP phosphatase NrnA [Oscillospiraceae bacterium]